MSGLSDMQLFIIICINYGISILETIAFVIWANHRSFKKHKEKGDKKFTKFKLKITKSNKKFNDSIENIINDYKTEIIANKLN